jgi:isoquinoline 1-oxidoreductase subunit beta
MNPGNTGINRRNFLKTGVAGATGLVIGFNLPGRFAALAASPVGPAAPAALNAWMRIGTDDSVTIMIDKSEMGQGIQTALCMPATEELECDWKKIRTEFAPAAKEYFNPAFGMQGTGGSSSVRSSWEPMRQAGAAAREMLVEAAAQKWGVEKTSCRGENGVVRHQPTKRKLPYGSLAAAAAKLPVPTDVPLKDPAEFRVIGKSTRRLECSTQSSRAARYLAEKLPALTQRRRKQCPASRTDPDFRRCRRNCRQYVDGDAGAPGTRCEVGGRRERTSQQ